ncbi:MAG: hypothetical protein V2A73_05650 [Pseudomonadota bacterium]
MKHLHLVVPVLLASCHVSGVAEHGRMAAPPDIHATCAVSRKDVQCSFSNRGGTGETCVVALFVPAATTKVVATKSMCSGLLGSGEMANSSTPIDESVSDSSGSVLRIVHDPDRAEQYARAWQTELSSSSSPTSSPLNTAECDALLEKTISLIVSARAQVSTPTGLASFERAIGDARQLHSRSLRVRCQSEVSRAHYECLLKADSLTAAEQCFVAVAPQSSSSQEKMDLISAPSRSMGWS